MANLINKMLKAELVKYIVDATVGTEQEEFACDLTAMLKKELVVKAERIYADTLQEEPADAHEETLGEEDLGDDRHSALEEPVLSAESAQYFHMHFQANFQKKLNDGTQTPQDWGCAVTFRKLDDGKWVCQKSSTRNLQWMTKPKVVYAGKYEKGVEREVVSVTERDIKVLKYWLTSGRYGKTMSQYFSNDELPNYDACEIGKPIYKDVREESSEIPF